ncbi:dimethylaniline monooxygenase, putative [Metarhizium acridum CQMa 102]|uniref:Dimethylaniline monooxygenase, putative n=1 Tax=Metarhizium acridum (strain CQMa 102) TaxID=655827 RepID=E9DX76_METAQ|nr:dimethylaniline monooxygenase, putative [Metarhizium acridum CQMa 102]EFY91634.1 dimethylaniline monooxygenase, putative [Metarhizium acridum CQMa 102]
MLTTNVPDIAMCFSDSRFAYGPFVPHYIARQYVENYFAIRKTDAFLQLNTTVEDLSSVALPERGGARGWKLTLRKYDATRNVDVWREEFFDAVMLANGHYSVPYVPQVPGLEAYITDFPGRVSHSKFYRSPLLYESKRVIVVGNSASGHDVSADLVSAAQHPVYVSRRSKSKWDGDEPPFGISWKPTIREFQQDGRVVFSDDTYLDDIDAVIYCTGYKASFPFWNEQANKQPLWDYKADRLVKSYWHTFFRDYPNLGIVGLPRTLTFRSFEYQAVALARLWSNRNSIPLPSREDQEAWELHQTEKTRARRGKFHDIPWENGETTEYLKYLFNFAGLGTISGEGRIPPALGRDLVWAIENIHKYPEHTTQGKKKGDGGETVEEGWVLVANSCMNHLGFT